MRLRTIAWVSGVWWLLPLQIVATHYVLSANYAVRSGYTTATQVWVLEAQTLTLSLASLAAAIAASRIYRSGTLNRPLGRGAVAVFLPVAGILAVGTLLVNLTFQMVHIGWAHLVEFDILLVLAPALWAIAAVSIGTAFGKIVVLPLAAPLSVLVVYILVGFPGAFDPPWIRHMTPVILGCCDYREQLELRVVLAASLSGIGFIGASSIIWIRLRGARWLTALYSAATLIPLLVVSGVAVQSLSYDAVQPREGRLECHDFGVEVCVWPETRDALLSAADQLKEISAIAAANSIDTPKRFIDNDAALISKDDAEFIIWSEASPVDVKLSIVSAMMPQLTQECFTALESQRADDAIAASFSAIDRSKQWWDSRLLPDAEQADSSAPVDQLNAAKSAIRACDRDELESLW